MTNNNKLDLTTLIQRFKFYNTSQGKPPKTGPDLRIDLPVVSTSSKVLMGTFALMLSFAHDGIAPRHRPPSGADDTVGRRAGVLIFPL